MPPTNRASWLTAKQSLANIVSDAPYTDPSTNEIVVKVMAVAINPADVAVQRLGILLTDYPAILGCDVAGEVVQVHPSLIDVYGVGDRVAGAAEPLTTRDGKYCYSGFQEYVVLKVPCIFKVPDGVEYEDAVVLPLATNTAASCLFTVETLNLQAPSHEIDSAENPKGTVLVWGASSSVGSCAVQMSAQAGYEVVGVASARNHGMVKDSGAVKCFDQGESNIINEAVGYLTGKHVVGAFLAVPSNDGLDTICQILDKSRGMKLVSSVTPGIEANATAGVRVTTNFLTSADSRKSIKTAIWQWLNSGVEHGKIKYLPKSEVVGRGLEDIQKAINILETGVSAKKLVVLF